MTESTSRHAIAFKGTLLLFHLTLTASTSFQCLQWLVIEWNAAAMDVLGTRTGAGQAGWSARKERHWQTWGGRRGRWWRKWSKEEDRQVGHGVYNQSKRDGEHESEDQCLRLERKTSNRGYGSRNGTLSVIWLCISETKNGQRLNVTSPFSVPELK